MFLSPHLHVTLPEVLLTGCSSAPRQQHSRKTDKKVSTPLVAAMVPPVTGGGPSLEGLQLSQPWSPGYLECPGPVTSPPGSDLGSFPLATVGVLCCGLVTAWLGCEPGSFDLFTLLSTPCGPSLRVCFPKAYLSVVAAQEPTMAPEQLLGSRGRNWLGHMRPAVPSRFSGDPGTAGCQQP